MFLCFGFFPEMTLGHGPKKGIYFSFSTAYFLLYWLMPFEICTIVWHSICTYNFNFVSLNCDITSDDFGFFPKNSRKRDMVWNIIWLSFDRNYSKFILVSFPMVDQKVTANEEVQISIVTIVKIHVSEWNKSSPDFQNGVIDTFHHVTAKRIILIKRNDWQNGDIF